MIERRKSKNPYYGIERRRSNAENKRSWDAPSDSGSPTYEPWSMPSSGSESSSSSSESFSSGGGGDYGGGGGSGDW